MRFIRGMVTAPAGTENRRSVKGEAAIYDRSPRSSFCETMRE